MAMNELLIVFALRRSGHHGVMRWLAGCVEFDILWYDDCQILKNSIKEARTHSFDRNTKNNKMYNFENYDIDKINVGKIEDMFLVQNFAVRKIFVLRDAYNWAASCLKKYASKKQRLQTNLNMDRWLTYAKEFSGETNYLGKDVVYINYNQWFLDVKYRKKIARQLRLNFSDEGKCLMGSESSFDGMAYENRADRMNVLERYQEYIDKDSYRALFTDEICQYNSNIFNMEIL